MSLVDRVRAAGSQLGMRGVRWLPAAWPFLLFGLTFALSWPALHEIRIRAFRTALAGLDRWSLALAVGATALNVAIMGLYDVLAFRQTRTTAPQRWRFGAVAFAWSNFLTLGPVAGPAIRLWLYRGSTDEPRELRGGVLAVSTAFVSGLAGWLIATKVLGSSGNGAAATAALALAVTAAAVAAVVLLAPHVTVLMPLQRGPGAIAGLALVGWLDWLLAATAFGTTLSATGARLPVPELLKVFFEGQAIGLASLIPGGVGTSDGFWISHIGMPPGTAAAALMAYRAIYYIGPWALASLLLLAWMAESVPQRADAARRVVGGLVAGGALLMMLSSASPMLHSRIPVLRALVPLPFVEAGQLTAAMCGVLLLVLARGLARGYRTAFRSTLLLILLAAPASILKGLDWEETLALLLIGGVAWSQSRLFDRDSEGDWIQGPELLIMVAALGGFLAFGTVAHHIGLSTLSRWSNVGYHWQSPRFLRVAVAMTLAVMAAVLHTVLRARDGFAGLAPVDVDAALGMQARLRSPQTNPLMVATGDKALFRDAERGCCLYRTIGPYLVVFADPVVGAPGDRAGFLDAFSTFARSLDRRPIFYQVSPEWIPLLHDHGYRLFKLGEQAEIPLERVTLEGHDGKLFRQWLRRADRDGLQFRVLPAEDVGPRLDELRDVSDHWLAAKAMSERQFSMGAFGEAYLTRFPCAIVEDRETGRIRAFANLLESPSRHELSVDLMRYRCDGPQTMDFLLASVMLDGKARGFNRFNLGMAPLSSVGERRSAHLHERLARLMFQRGHHWYNFQGLRQYKEKFDPEWMPRYMAYPTAWEWPMAVGYVCALIAGKRSGPHITPTREALADATLPQPVEI